MVDQLRVNAEALRHTGNEIADHGQALRALHQSCHREAEGAHPGWVGSSARVLAELLDNWAAVSTAQIRNLGEQSGAMYHAAAMFRSREQRSAATLTDVAGDSPMV